MTNIIQFTPRPREEPITFFVCTHCDSRMFRIYRRGVEAQIQIECANCANPITNFLVEEIEE